jgi:hypothetical protein
MTFDDDVIRFKFEGKEQLVRCKDINVAWPPPEKLSFMGFDMKRVSMSKVTDDERSTLDFLCRGAEYELIAATTAAKGNGN